MLVRERSRDSVHDYARASEPGAARNVPRLRPPGRSSVHDLSSAEAAGGDNGEGVSHWPLRSVAADSLFLGGLVQSRLIWRRFFRSVAARIVAVRPFRLLTHGCRLVVLLVRRPLGVFIS